MVRQTPHYNGISANYIEQLWNVIYPAIGVELDDLDNVEVMFSTRESEDCFSDRATYHIKICISGLYYYLRITERLTDNQPELRYHERIEANYMLPPSS